MTDPKPDRKSVFIEKIMPVTLLNEQVYYEHGGNPFKGLHRWYSRKLLSFSRASVLGSLLPADVTMEEFEYLLGLNRRGKDGLQDKTTKLYKTPPSPERIKKVQELCEQMWGTKTPTVLDAFAGGGSIPFEAARYGLNVLASDLNPVAVVTMKAAIEYPLKFGADLQVEIDKWVKWVGDEAEKRLAPFFPSLEGETVRNYLWAHTVTCPNCLSVVPLSPNWWIYRRPEKQNLHRWCAIKPIPDLTNKQIRLELVKGKKGKGSTIQTHNEEYNPETTTTISRGDGKCPNCNHLIESGYIDKKLLEKDFGHVLYAILFKKYLGNVEVRSPSELDLEAVEKAKLFLETYKGSPLIPSEPVLQGQDTRCYNRGVRSWDQLFNSRQLLTLVTYVEIINEAKNLLQLETSLKKSEAIAVYLSLVLDRCVDLSSRMSSWNIGSAANQRASYTHSLNLMWNYPESNGARWLWGLASLRGSEDYSDLCHLLGTSPNPSSILKIEKCENKIAAIDIASADDLSHISDKSIHTIVTDPPYYSTVQYGELSDFFYVWQKRTLGNVFPNFFTSEPG